MEGVGHEENADFQDSWLALDTIQQSWAMSRSHSEAGSSGNKTHAHRLGGFGPGGDELWQLGQPAARRSGKGGGVKPRSADSQDPGCSGAPEASGIRTSTQGNLREWRSPALPP
ncbi:hypothetical protein LEMLEM_LOCUS16599 [Lemmus lemmus]